MATYLGSRRTEIKVKVLQKPSVIHNQKHARLHAKKLINLFPETTQVQIVVAQPNTSKDTV